MGFTIFASRNSKELLRDPLSLVFCIAFPMFLMILVFVLNKSLPASDLFDMRNFAPGTAVFSFSFLTLFSGMLISKDRGSSFLTRLFATPLKASDYIVGYSLPLVPIALLQSTALFITAFFVGLPLTFNVLTTLFVLIPSALLFSGFGLLFGSIFSDKQVGGVFSIFVWMEAFLSGMWVDLDKVGGIFKAIAEALPFVHAVDAAKSALTGDYLAIIKDLLWVLAYDVVVLFFASWFFKKRMKA